jgi:hypothetical protein
VSVRVALGWTYTHCSHTHTHTHKHTHTTHLGFISNLKHAEVQLHVLPSPLIEHEGGTEHRMHRPPLHLGVGDPFEGGGGGVLWVVCVCVCVCVRISVRVCVRVEDQDYTLVHSHYSLHFIPHTHTTHYTHLDAEADHTAFNRFSRQILAAEHQAHALRGCLCASILIL